MSELKFHRRAPTLIIGNDDNTVDVIRHDNKFTQFYLPKSVR